MNVLFLCTGNSARSILAEATFNHLAPRGWHATSAGSHPKGSVHPRALALLKREAIPTEGLRSKSWDNLPTTPDIVITVCASAAGEACPAYLGRVLRAHWNVDDPAAARGSDAEIDAAFRSAYRVLRKRIEAFLALPLDELQTNHTKLKADIDRIGALLPSSQCAAAPSVRVAASMGVFERYLTVWVFLCILAGIVLGQLSPDAFQAIGRLEFARVNLPVGALIWVMIIPMLMKVDFGALHEVRRHVRGIGVTLFVNWLVKPFSMAFFAWLLIRGVFAPLLPASRIDSYIAGLILLAAAPCTAMVFVWSRLSNGDPLFTLTQVALNDTIMVFAFAPIVALLLGISSITVPWSTLLTSVVLYIVIPVLMAQALRQALRKRGQAAFDAAMTRIGPWSITALLATLVLLFAFQGEAILRQPLVIAILAVPILIQVLFNSTLAYWLNRRLGEQHAIACPSALIGASNFFELAVAAAISLFGFESGAALATVVGVLIEVPVMLLVVHVVNATRDWYAAGSQTPSRAPSSRRLSVGAPISGGSERDP